MAKRVYEITKTEQFAAGMSTNISIQLDESGKGTATVTWKRGEQKTFPVKSGQRLFVNMWGGFPDVEVWELPKPPKNEIMRFLWENGFPKKKVWKFDDPRFVDFEAGDEHNGTQTFTYTMCEGKVKMLIGTTEWSSSISEQIFTGWKNIFGVAFTPGATLEEVKNDFLKLKARYDGIAIVPAP